MYLITNEGLRALEESGLKKILDESFKNLDHYLLGGHIYDDQIEEYAEEKGIPDLVEKVEADDFLEKKGSFILHSKIICDLLRDKLPENITSELENAVSAYYIYYDRFLGLSGYRGSFLWRDDNFVNIIEGDTHGDMRIYQYDITLETQFDPKPFIKKTNLKAVTGHYDNWPKTLIDFITFCCQINKPVPFKDNWEEVFYGGKFEEENPGSVAAYYIRYLKYVKEDGEHSFMKVLPFLDNPMKHIDQDKKIYFVQQVMSSNRSFSFPFIDGDSLVYLHKSEKGIVEVNNEIWGNPSVRFNYDQIHQAIKGVVNCIQNNSSRCLPHDPGLIFKHFPYEKFEDLD